MATYLSRVADRLKLLTAVVASAGTADADKLVALNSSGKFDASVLNIGTATNTVAAGDHLHDSRYLKLAGGNLSGPITFGTTNPNPAIRVRHINGKGVVNDTDDTLYLNYSVSGKGVQVGAPGGNGPLTVYGLTRIEKDWDSVYGNLFLKGNAPAITLFDRDHATKWMIHNDADQLIFYRTLTGTETAYDWQVRASINNAGTILSAALAGAGNRAVYSDPSGNLTNTASDRRLKTAIAPIRYGLADVLRLAPVSFRWKNPQLGGQTEIGLIAQDVQAIIPEVIGRNADAMLSIDYPKLVAVLINAIKDLNIRIQVLEARP